MSVQKTTAGTVRMSMRSQHTDWAGITLQILLLLSMLFSLAVLLVLLYDQLRLGISVFLERGVGFLTSPLSSNPAKAGVAQGILGSAMIAVLVPLMAFPVGILSSVYLEEYAPDNRITRFITINIRNLAGVPSVVYGLLGLSIFVAAFGSLGLGSGRNIITGALTLAVLVLPIVIITSSEAIRAVPSSLREGGFGAGASHWQVVRKLILPAAMPGILTGTVLALSRAIGETAPLIVAGAVLGSFSTGGAVTDLLFGSYTALPAIVYDWARKPQAEFRELTAAAIMVLLVVTLLANGLAIALRSRHEQTW